MIHLPYGKSFLEFSGDVTVITSPFSDEKAENPVRAEMLSGAEIVKVSMENPFGGVTLCELAKNTPDCTVIISDHTRPVPSKDILPLMLKELREGNPDIKITLLVATGLHRETTKEELREKLGDEIYHNEHIEIHDASDPDKNVLLGTLPSGAPLYIDKTAAEAGLLISEGFIEPHFFAGFSGGRKSVLPGVSGRLTVLGNHCGAFIADPHARTGILEDNPVSRDMEAAAEMAHLRYIVNVVIDEEHRTIAAFSGEPKAAHKAGCEFVKKMFLVKPGTFDIVITTNGGAPLDQNIYQCVKSMTAAESCCRNGGVIIVCAECADGKGGEVFYQSLKNCENAAALYDEYCKVPQEETIADQWQSQILARVLKNHPVIFVTRPELKDVIEDMKMVYAPTVQEAYEKARGLCIEAFLRGTISSLAGITTAVIPNGISVIIE